MSLRVGGIEIAPWASSVTWSGSIGAAARTLNVTLARGALPEWGDKVEWHYREAAFYGVVVYVDKTEKEVSFEAMDLGVYLVNNYAYGEYRGNPAQIAARICAEFGVGVGSLAAGGGKTKVTSTGNLSAYEVIRRAYEGEDRARNRGFIIRVEGRSLMVEPIAGGTAVASIGEGALSARHTQSIRNMVNRVVVINTKGKKSDEVKNAADIARAGSFQRTYREEKGKSARTEAKKLLSRVERTGSLSAVGNEACAAGKWVVVDEPKSSLGGLYLIEADTHTIDGGGHRMKLEFYYE